MSRTNQSLPALAFAIACVSLTAPSAVAQCSMGRAAPAQPYRSSKVHRQADRLEGYQMRAPAAEAVAAGRRANGMIGVAGRIGKLEAAGELRLAEAGYLEICVSTGRRKLDAMKDLAPINQERLKFEQDQADLRNQKRIQAGLARATQVQQGEWPLALLDESFRTSRDELAVAVGGRPGFVAHGEQINWQYAAMVAGQMREQLRGRVRELPQPDYAKALRFLEELKCMGIQGEIGERT